MPFVGASLLVEASRGFTAGPQEWHDGSFSAHRRCMGETCQELMQL